MADRVPEHQLRYQQLAGLWTAAQPVVAGFIASLVRDHHAAEDLLQKTASALVAKFDDYEADRPFVPWAIGVARFEVLNYLRQTQRDPHQFATDTLDAVADAYSEIRDDLSDRKSALTACMDALPERSRSLMNLRYVEGLTPSQIAARTDMNPNQARVTLHRIRASLRECIEKRTNGGKP